MTNTQSKDLIRLDIPKLVKRLAIPASIGYFFHTMYNVVDTFFGGWISTGALAALSLSFPVFFIIISIGTGISTGTTALIANALGADDQDEARRIAIQGLSFGVLMAVVLTFLGIMISPFLFTLLGASDDYLTICLTYMNTIFYGTGPFMIVFMLNAVLNAQGETKPFRNFLVAGFFLNVVLDPWFIYGGLGIPPLGIVGIALATVLIQCVGCLYLGFRVSRTGLISRESLKDILPKPRPFKEIARQGLPASFNIMTIGLGIFVIIYFVSDFGKSAVAAYGAAMRVEQMALVPVIGLNIATLTLVAQNNGAGLFHRVRAVVNTTLIYGAALMAVGMVLILILAPRVMDIFTNDQSVIDIGSTYLRIDALVLYGYVILSVHIAMLQGMKKPMYAIWIGLYRQILCPYLVFYLFAHILGFGLLGIWWGIFSITWSAALVTVFYARRQLKRAIALSIDAQ